MKRAFTLIELLVVVGMVALLFSLLLPALGLARSQAYSVLCKSNIRQIVLANLGYSSEHDDSLVLGAADMAGDNNRRWHGVRDNKNQPFDPLRGGLVQYLDEGEVKECPQQVDFRHGDPWEWDYEDGAGGYGYNLSYLGSRLWADSGEPYAKSAKYTQVRSPGATLMFADTAMAKLDQGAAYYLEYSFAEPPYFLFAGQVQKDWGNSSPSIHFRHGSKANIGWVDGHVDSEEMIDYDQANVYGVNSQEMSLGWFGVLENSYFDLR